jgi:hypothetical protein
MLPDDAGDLSARQRKYRRRGRVGDDDQFGLVPVISTRTRIRWSSGIVWHIRTFAILPPFESGIALYTELDTGKSRSRPVLCRRNQCFESSSRWRGLANAVIWAPTGRTRPRARPVLTQDILFDMNLLTLTGFVVMGLTLTLNRMGQAGKGLSIGLMAAGTALVFLGLYAGGWSE